MLDIERIGGGERVLYDVVSREIAVRDRIDSLRRDFQAPPGALRFAIGKRLIRLGLRLQGFEPRPGHLEILARRHAAARCRPA